MVAIGPAGGAYVMYAHVHLCTRLYLDTDAMQLALNSMVALTFGLTIVYSL